MNDEAKVIGIIGILVLIVFGGFVIFATKSNKNSPSSTTAKVDTSLLIREDSHQTTNVPHAEMLILLLKKF